MAVGLGLKLHEAQEVLRRMGRALTITEWGIFASLWSEHCSYKSSRKWLGRLPTAGKRVICGPGENAGVVDIGGGLAVVFKMESHNHPSFIEPYHGAATGVGGVMRDVFTMGARPVALLNALRFGDVALPKTRYLISGVVSGLGGYGNCVGVPMLGGQVEFHPSYNGNNLVNAMCVGLVERDRIFLSKASGIGNAVLYAGSRTGRDGIHGASMASASFSAGERAQEQRSAVQVGDPFAQKVLMEACLELMREGCVVAVQDMGAAGLASASVEMAERGCVGIDIDLDCVPVRCPGMGAHEIMLSESQERMLIVIEAGREDAARVIFDRWGVDSSVIGRIVEERTLTVRYRGTVEACVPLGAVGAPTLDWPWVRGKVTVSKSEDFPEKRAPVLETLKSMMAGPHLCSRQWVYQQYDSTVMADTIEGPGSDAGVVRVHGTRKALAVSVDCTARYCLADPYEGGKQAVAECWRNICTTGAEPLAVTDCLNFGSPEDPETMGQVVGVVEGIALACKALDFPVVSGNVSLYNATAGRAIAPTPAVGGVGLIDDLDGLFGNPGQRKIEDGDLVVLVGVTAGYMCHTVYAEMFEPSCRQGPVPPVDLVAERELGECVRSAVVSGVCKSAHDVSDGGVLVAIAEMSLACGVGVKVRPQEKGLPVHVWAFCEDQARYLLAVSPGRWGSLKISMPSGLPAAIVGIFSGDSIALEGQELPIEDLRRAWSGGFGRLMREDFRP